MKTIWSWIDALARLVIRLIGKVSPKLGGLCEKLWNNTELVAYLFAGVATTVVNYVVSLVGLTRQHAHILRGASPRATLAVVDMAKATAFMNGRDYVLPEDVQTVFAGTVAHRLLLSADAQAQNLREEQLLTGLLSQVSPPRV